MRKRHMSHRPGAYGDCLLCMSMLIANTANAARGNPARNLTDAEAQELAVALEGYVLSEGRSVSRWLDEKKLTPGDRLAVLRAWSHLEDSGR